MLVSVFPRVGEILLDVLPRFGECVRMKLIEWMRAQGLDDDAVAAAVGDVSAHAVKKWKYDERIPRKAQLRRLTEVTNGQVTANDFMHAQEADA